MTTVTTRPLTILIAAMGGEGGGVLMDWIVSAANAKGLAVQATSIPGVAQRTGATTYYVELWPKVVPDGSPSPIFSLNPSVGEVDVMIATELAEGGRALENGFITNERTTLIGSTHRVFLNVEKMAMGDGRLEEKKLFEALKACAKKAILFDGAELAQKNGTVINSVMLGALAGADCLPLSADDLTGAIKAEGKAVEPNLAGFAAGLDVARTGTTELKGDPAKRDLTSPAQQALEGRVTTDFPSEAHDILIHGVRRLSDYQNAAYAATYLDRMAAFAGGNGQLCREVARHLAVRMSFEDIIRVAQAKVRSARTTRIQGELNAESHEPFHVTEFFKPGVQEIADILPPSLAKSLLGWAERTGRLNKLHWGMEVRTTTIFGFLKVRLLAGLRWWRPRSHRWAAEQAQIDAWLQTVKRAADKDAGVAHEVAELARLIKGYGSTHRRGSRNYNTIMDTLVLPALDGAALPADLAGRIAAAKQAALADPEGTALGEALKAPALDQKLAAE